MNKLINRLLVGASVICTGVMLASCGGTGKCATNTLFSIAPFVPNLALNSACTPFSATLPAPVAVDTVVTFSISPAAVAGGFYWGGDSTESGACVVLAGHNSCSTDDDSASSYGNPWLCSNDTAAAGIVDVIATAESGLTTTSSVNFTSNYTNVTFPNGTSYQESSVSAYNADTLNATACTTVTGTLSTPTAGVVLNWSYMKYYQPWNVAGFGNYTNPSPTAQCTTRVINGVAQCSVQFCGNPVYGVDLPPGVWGIYAQASGYGTKNEGIDVLFPEMIPPVESIAPVNLTPTTSQCTAMTANLPDPTTADTIVTFTVPSGTSGSYYFGTSGTTTSSCTISIGNSSCTTSGEDLCGISAGSVIVSATSPVSSTVKTTNVPFTAPSNSYTLTASVNSVNVGEGDACSVITATISPAISPGIQIDFGSAITSGGPMPIGGLAGFGSGVYDSTAQCTTDVALGTCSVSFCGDSSAISVININYLITGTPAVASGFSAQSVAVNLNG